jgi:hypothetical protein
MACTTNTQVGACLEVVYNVQLGTPVSQTVTCGGACTPASEFLFPNLTIRTPLTFDYEVSISDNLQATCTLDTISSP